MLSKISFSRLKTTSATLVALVGSLLFVGTASAGTPAPGWSFRSDAEPTVFNAGDSQDEVEKITVKATEGTYELLPATGAVASAPIAWDAPASRSEETAGGPESVEKALEALAVVGAGNVSVTGGPGDATGGKPYTVTLVGSLSGNNKIGNLLVRESKLKDGAAEGTVTIDSVQASKASDRLTLRAVNVGSRASAGEITIADKLAPGLVATELRIREPTRRYKEECPNPAKATCTWPSSQPVLPGSELVVEVVVAVTSPSLVGPLVNEATFSEAGGGVTSARAEIPLNVGSSPFGIAQFGFSANGLDGAPDAQAGEHPYGVTTTIDLNSLLLEGRETHVVQAVRDVSVELPLGFLGDPLASERCPEIDLTDSEGALDTAGSHTACPPGSMVGRIVLGYSGEEAEDTVPYPVYNVVPEHGYPAELGFNAGLGQPIYLYASVLPSPSGYRLRITTPGTIRVPSAQEPDSIRTTIFGAPGEVNGAGGSAAFLRNPTGCSLEPLKASLYVTSWEGSVASAETSAYPEVTGCNLLSGASAFDPSIEVTPETTQVDTPSGYVVDLKVPQAPNLFGSLATPDLRNATVRLPEGVSLSPSVASGPESLAGCAAQGPNGINLGSSHVEPDGQDVGDPYATELGAGHPGGDNSPYDDGLWHAAPGHCPSASQIGDVEVKTPLLEEPLKGHVYVAQPSCGGSGQPVCTSRSAEDGELYGIYLELSGSGVILKLHGRVSANASTGQLTTTFSENPQLPFEEFKLKLYGGQRAALANPQSCATAITSSEFEPWSAPESGPNATPFSSFAVTGCGGGGAPFHPVLTAGTLTALAGAYSPFTFQLARQDGEQDLQSVESTLPYGLLAKIAGVLECGEAQANTGTCPEGSRIGSVAVSAGSGSEPLVEHGSVYLTGPYNNGPFGIAVVVPAVAGPFDLGNVIVRGSIRIDPLTARASVVSNPFPTIVDGVPLRVKTVDVTLDREQFTLNPTNCDTQSVTGTIHSTQGTTDAASNPFAVTGCAGLRFEPKFAVSTSDHTSRENGASLHVKLTYPSGSFGKDANIAKVKVDLPKQLVSRLTTLQKACVAKTFEANPAECPADSIVGHAKALTPLIPVPLEGPAYFVSYGGAKFPELVMVLQGYGVTVQLHGETFISKAGITSSTYRAVPDVPVGAFELTLPQGPYSALGANANLCTVKGGLKMPTALIGQNGAEIHESTKIGVTGCPKAKAEVKGKKAGSKGGHSTKKGGGAGKG